VEVGKGVNCSHFECQELRNEWSVESDFLEERDEDVELMSWCGEYQSPLYI
jgi:hypothetical protein